MVVGDDGQVFGCHGRFDVRAFSSRESAEEFIDTYTEEIKTGLIRYKELEELRDKGSLNELEEAEYNRLYWDTAYFEDFFDDGCFYIKEYELYE